MSNLYIKHMKPQKNSKYHSGRIDPKTCKKYADSCRKDPIFYRSGLELQFMQYCENNPGIVKWASEPIAIPYYSRIKGKIVNYYPDFVFENKKGNIVIVEVKPESQTVRPDMCDTKWLKEQWIVNCDKWKAAKKFADEHNMKFIFVTEKFFN